MIGRLRFLLLTLLLIVAVSPVFAQSAPALTQAVKMSTDDGLTLTISFPADWSGGSDDNSLFVASSAIALNEIKSTGTLKTAGATGIIVYPPSFLDHVNLPHTAPPEQVINAYLQSSHISGTPESSSDFSVPAATTSISDASSGIKAVLGALGFPAGTVVFGVISPDGTADATDMAILQSITLTSASDQIAAQSTEPTGQAVPLATTSFNEPTPYGSFEIFSVGLPDGWVSQHDTAGLIYLASSQAALDTITSSNNVLSSGEVGISIVLPPALGRLGIGNQGRPADIMSEFESKFHVSGQIQTDSSFPEDAVYLHLVGGQTPSGGGIAYALAFDNSAMLVIVQPEAAYDATTLAILKSINLAAPGQVPTPTPNPNAVTLTVPDTIGSNQVTIALPDGWVSQNPQNGLLNFANSQDALTRLLDSKGTPQPGDVGMILFTPLLTRPLGVHFDSTPEDAVKSIESNLQVSGDVQIDNSFSTPAAYALVSGSNVPQGGGAIYAIKYDAGIVVILIQPATAIDDALKQSLQSIQFHSVMAVVTPEITAEPTATPTAQPTTVTTASGDLLRQWAVKAEGSSEYSDTGWNFAQATGKPNTATCDDNETAWASESSTERAILKVSFAHPVIPSQINIYQSFNPGAIVEVDLGSSVNPDKVLPLPNSADPPGNTPCLGYFSVNVTGVDTPVDFVVIYVDQSITGNWDEIDAVQLVGTPVN
ncbi:MAG TPA: hypothetical protein VHD90_17680 [Phototrophicaceae bacterium]|nr:hypothetical protein [Phototrophicaceae bacterium]